MGELGSAPKQVEVKMVGSLIKIHFKCQRSIGPCGCKIQSNIDMANYSETQIFHLRIKPPIHQTYR